MSSARHPSTSSANSPRRTSSNENLPKRPNLSEKEQKWKRWTNIILVRCFVELHHRRAGSSNDSFHADYVDRSEFRDETFDEFRSLESSRANCETTDVGRAAKICARGHISYRIVERFSRIEKSATDSGEGWMNVQS